MSRRSNVPRLGEDDASTAPVRPPRPTLRALTDASYPDILADYEEAILSGCTKDEAAAFSLISDFDHTSFLARVLSEDPDWLNNLTAVGRTNLKATARVQTARKVRAGDSAFVMPVVQATSPDLAPHQQALPSGNTYNVVTYQIAVAPDGTKTVAASPVPIEAVITDK